MPRAAAQLPVSGPDRGFTLLEMLVVLAITGLVTGLLYPQVQTAAFAVRQRVAREQLAAGAEAAQAMAQRSGMPAALGMADGGRALVVSAPGVAARRFALDPAGRIRLVLRPQIIVFYPDGSTTGGELMLGTSTAGRPGDDGTSFVIDRDAGRLRELSVGQPVQGGA